MTDADCRSASTRFLLGELQRNGAVRLSARGYWDANLPRAVLRDLSVHGIEEVVVRLRLAELVEQELDAVHRPHRV